jgi:outer membrane receptor protein involved in Fe transport
MRLLFIIFLISLFQFNSTAQTTKQHQLSGKITDNKGEAVPYAAIAAFKTSDSSYVNGAASDMDGNFALKLTNGNYYVKVSFLSFENKVLPNININNKDIKLPPVKLLPSSLKLEEFEFVDEKKAMEIDLDKKVFNVEKDITSQGSNAAEILNNVPSVSVDVEGNVSLRGSGNVRILINGKPSGLTGTSTADALRQLQGSQIEKVEVISNPSARYDAEGEVGIINIVLKKDNRQGVNGSINADIGYPGNYGAGFNLSYKKNAVTIFTAYNASYRESPGFSSSTQTFTYPDTSFKYTNNAIRNRDEINNNFKLGTEIYLNEMNSITLSGNGNVGTAYNTVDVTYTDYDEANKPFQIVTRDEFEDKVLSSYDLSFNYRKTFTQKDRLLTMDAQYSNNRDDEESIIVQNNSIDITDNTYTSVYNYEGSRNILLQTDYVHPFENKGKFEMGFRGNYKTIDDDYAVSLMNKSINQFEIAPGFKNLMYYYENISAGYMMYGQKINKFSYQLGLRAEYSEVTTEFVATNDINKRDYLNLFPTTHLSYQVKDENAIQLSYSRRIKRPQHWWLLPFYSISDVRNNFYGNPNLNPEYTDAFETGYINYFKKGSLLTSLYYRYSTGVTERILISSTTGTTERIPANIGFRNAFGVEFSGSYQLYKWWDLRGDVNFFREITDGNYQGKVYYSDTYAWSTKLNSKWTIKKKLGIQSSFDFNAPQQTPQGRQLARYGLNIGASIDVLKGNGTISFNASDIFNMRKRRSIDIGDNFYSEGEFQWRARFFRLSFSYRINQTKKQAEKNNRNNNFDEGGGGM